MPQVVAFAMTVISSAVSIASAVGGAMGLGTGIAAIIGGGAAIIAGGTIIAKKAMGLFEVEMPKVDTDASRQRTVRSTTEPYKTIYGETLVSGPISYIGMKGTDNEDLYHVIALAGHEVTDITDIYFDNELIEDSQINGGSSAGGNVTAGTFGPKNSTTICIINKHLGTATQAADSMMVNAFSDYTSAHQGKGIAYIAMKWKLNEDSAEVWDKYAPTDIKAIVKGRKVYDPRLEYAADGTYGQDVTNASYIAYSTNPALCLADYLINADFGMGIAVAKIDWEAIVTAADGCDVSVSVPGGTEKRFTTNGVLFGTDSHRRNIDKILSSMNGNLVYSNGKYIAHAGIYEAPTESLNEDDLIGAISIKTSFERSDRFNTIKGLFVDPAQNHKSSEFPKVQLADAVTRDNNEVLEKEVQYPMTNSSYMAQRLSNKLIQLSDQQKVVSFPANLSALRITAGDRVQVSVDELSWSNKVFICVGWGFSEEGGVNLTLREDSSTSYADPASNEYSTLTATGDITDAFRGVPSPSGLSVTAGLKNNELNWVNPARPADYGTIYVYASPNGNFSSAVKIGETDGTQFIHDASNSADSVSAGDVRYYWVRAVKNVGTDAASQSNLEPNADPNTTVFATVGRVNWADVSGSTNAPADNATVGAQISVNLYDTDGSTVMNQADVKNSVLAQEILQVEVESGEVLDLETGADVDIQNLGDVAIFVSDSNVTLNSSISTVASNLSALEDTIVDLTSGVSDIYIQASQPVPGQGGIPDPIPTFSRWYDSDDNNHPYYWTGSAWQSLKDADIEANSVAITNLTSNLATTNTNVSANSSAITALDTLTVAQGNSITSLNNATTALESTVNNASTGVAANASAVSSLTTRVTNTENATTVNSNNITTLTSDLDQAETDIATKASSTALNALTTRVTAAEGSITTQSADITALESTVDDSSTGVAANASGLSALTTRVTTAEGAITTNSSAVTTLDATYTEDLHFRTEVEDENDDLIDLETSGTVQLQDLSDFVSGSSSAIDSLTVQTYVNEDNIQTQAIQLTALESTVNDPTNGVVATAGALSNLTTEVSVIDGVVTSTAQDLTTLTTTVGGNTASITTQAESINGVEANYSVKIDNNNRITGFGLLSTTSGSTPFSEFAVVADQFSIVDPASTADTPLQPFTVTASKIVMGTDVQIDGGLVVSGTIKADRLSLNGTMFTTETVGSDVNLVIADGGVDTTQVADNAVTLDKIADTLQSTDYVQGSAGWKLTTDGTFEAGDGTFRGNITSTSGTIGGFTLGSTSLTAGDATTRVSLSTADGISLGDNTFANAPFRVTPAGALTATSATITGSITASSGSFTGAVSVGTTGNFYGGTSTAFNTGKGFFLGYDTDAYKLSIGDASTGKSLTWDGDKLNVAANAVSFATGGEPTYNSNSRVPVSVRSSVLDLTSNTDYVFFANDFDQNLTLYASFYAGPLTSGTISGETNAQNAIMSQLSLQIQYAENVGGSPSTWQNFGSAALSSKKFTSSQLNSNYYVKVTDLGSGNYRADLATASEAAADFTGLGHSDYAYGITDEDYYMTEQVTVYGFPKGEYFIRVVVAVTDGTYSPYPATGSPALTNPRRLSINNALTYTDSDHGLSSVAKGNPQTYFTGLFNNTLIDGGSLTIAVNEENATSNRYGGIFIAGRGETTDPNSIQPLGGIYFYNGVDDLGSGAGDVGSPNHGITVPKTGDSLDIEAAGNGIKFNGGYAFGGSGATIDTNGNYFANGNITISGTVSQGSDIRLKSDVETIDGSKVFGMRGVSFVKNGEKGAGVIAQELQEIAPELVKEGSDGMLSVAYGDLIGYLIESVKTLKDEIEQIKADQS